MQVPMDTAAPESHHHHQQHQPQHHVQRQLPPRTFAPHATKVVLIVWMLLLLLLRLWNKTMFSSSMERMHNVFYEDYDELMKESKAFELKWDSSTAQLESDFAEITKVVQEAIRHYRMELKHLGVAYDVEALTAAALDGDQQNDDSESSSSQRRTLQQVHKHHHQQGGGSGGVDLDVRIAPIDSKDSLDEKLAKMIKKAKLQELQLNDAERSFFKDGGNGGSPNKKGLSKEDADALAKEMETFVLEVYTVLYRMAQYQDRVVRYREVFAPFIEAIEKRRDKMLYNYI